MLFVLKVAVVAPLLWAVLEFFVSGKLLDELAKSMVFTGIAAMVVAYFSKED